MKKIFAALVCAMPFVANAEGMYVGLGYAHADRDSGITNVANGTLDETDNTTKFTVGYEIDDTFAVEGFYLNDAEASLSGASATWNNADGSSDNMGSSNPITDELDAIGFAFIAKLDVNADLSLLGKVGYYKWDYKLSAANVHLPAYDIDDKDMMYGIGAEYKIDENVALRAEYETYKGGRNKSATDTGFDLMSASLVYKF